METKVWAYFGNHSHQATTGSQFSNSCLHSFNKRSDKKKKSNEILQLKLKLKYYFGTKVIEMEKVFVNSICFRLGEVHVI